MGDQFTVGSRAVARVSRQWRAVSKNRKSKIWKGRLSLVCNSKLKSRRKCLNSSRSNAPYGAIKSDTGTEPRLFTAATKTVVVETVAKIVTASKLLVFVKWSKKKSEIRHLALRTTQRSTLKIYQCTWISVLKRNHPQHQRILHNFHTRRHHPPLRGADHLHRPLLLRYRHCRHHVQKENKKRFSWEKHTKRRQIKILALKNSIIT